MAAKKRSKKAVAKKVSKRPAKKAKAAPAKKAAKRSAKKAKAKAKPAAAPVAAPAAPKKASRKKAAKVAAPPAAAVGSKKARKGKAKKAARATGKAKEATPDEEALDAGESSEGIGPGSRAPAFKIADQDGNEVASHTLQGTPYVLYFYPKDDTPGCTIEACDFRDSLPKFERAGVRVIGVSPDKSESHARFSKKYGLPFTLLADTELSLSNSYGVWVKKKNYGREYMGVQRSTFLVDAKGVIRGAWRGIKVPGHVIKVLGHAEQL